MLALASVARIALVATQLNQDPVVASLLRNAPADAVDSDGPAVRHRLLALKAERR